MNGLNCFPTPHCISPALKRVTLGNTPVNMAVCWKQRPSVLLVSLYCHCVIVLIEFEVVLAESEGMLQRIVDEFDRVCKRRKLKMNAGISKVMVFERAREQTINFA